MAVIVSIVFALLASIGPAQATAIDQSAIDEAAQYVALRQFYVEICDFGASSLKAEGLSVPQPSREEACQKATAYRNELAEERALSVAERDRRHLITVGSWCAFVAFALAALWLFPLKRVGRWWSAPGRQSLAISAALGALIAVLGQAVVTGHMSNLISFLLEPIEYRSWVPLWLPAALAGALIGACLYWLYRLNRR